MIFNSDLYFLWGLMISLSDFFFAMVFVIFHVYSVYSTLARVNVDAQKV